MATLLARGERADTGEAAIELADVIATFQTPGFDPARDTLGCFDGERLVGYAEYEGHGRGTLEVDPDARPLAATDEPREPPREVEPVSTLLAWLVDRAGADGSATLRMPVARGSYVDGVLAARGWAIGHTTWVLRLPPGAEIPERPLPPGYTLGAARPPEYPETLTVIEDAFSAWTARPRRSLAEFEAQVLRRPGFAPWQIRVVRDPGGAIVAAAVVFLAGDETYVQNLATRLDQRGRGLAQALLADCFRAGRGHGGIRAGLSTDSRTGALDLYLKVGMRVEAVWLSRELALGEITGS